VGPIEQLKGAWGWSSILLARTSSGKFFFKASYRKPPYEAVAVDELSRDWPNHVPRLVGVDRGRNWMIMHDFGETRLNELDDGYRRRAVRTFARLQEASSGLAEKWRGLGCNAAGPPGMIPDLERLLGETAILRCGPDALSDDEIESLIGAVPVLADRCVRLSDSSIPVTIHNEDFRSDNVVWHDNSFIFFDWSNTAVTHPFFSMNYFLNRMKRPDGTSSLRWKVLLEDPARQALRDAYLEAWHDYAGMDELRDEFSRVRGLFFLYEAIRCYRDLPYLEPDAPWTRNAVVYIPRCLRDLRDALELDGVR
jgi:hypothetical protein